MKRLFLFMSLPLALTFTSCEKCTDCSCVGYNNFTFEEGMPEEDQDFLTDQYSRDYQDREDEVCASRGSDFDDAVADYEDQSLDFDESSTYQGNTWSLEAKYECTCED